MQDIDFLPADFKRRRTRRHGRSWQAITLAAAAGIVAVVAMAQSRTLRQIQQQVAQTEPERQLLDARQTQLDDLRQKLADAEARADLLAYLDHPWPKTQLLAATLHQLPDAVVCNSILLTRDAKRSQPASRAAGGASEEDAASLRPATRDLRKLEEECDHAVTAIVLKGVTSDGIELHRYLDSLNREPLVDKVKLHSLEASDGESDAKFRFEARLTVRPGFGLPDGPDGRARQIAKSSISASPSPTELHRP